MIENPSKKIAESLVIKGLQGYETIAERIDATAPNANLKARALADKAFRAGLSSSCFGKLSEPGGQRHKAWVGSDLIEQRMNVEQ